MAPEAPRGAEAQVRGRQQGLQNADEAEGGAAVGDEVHLVAVGTQEGRELLQRFEPGSTRAGTHLAPKTTTTSSVFTFFLNILYILTHILYSHGLLGHSDPLAALWRLPLEHVAVVGSGRGGVLGQRGAGAQL